MVLSCVVGAQCHEKEGGFWRLVKRKPRNLWKPLCSVSPMVAASAALLWLDLAQIGDVRGHATGLSLERMIRLPNPEITPAIHNSDTEEYRALDFA